ncbi:hypothetical protein GALLN_00446 [Gallionellaceae bacterium]|nr:hypothetical protein GALLN_00446 [Gallionellaceae bacterium]
MFFMSRAVSTAIIVFFLAACSTVQIGQNFDVRSVQAKIERGITTQDQIRAWLGTPTNTGGSLDTGGERFDEWTYYYASGKLPAMSDARIKMLQIKFDKQGIVRGYNWSASDQ